MSEAPKGMTRAEFNDFADNFYDVMEKSEAVLTMDDVHTIETILHEETTGRRFTLALLTKSYKELEKEVLNDRGVAEAVAYIKDLLDLDKYRQLIDSLQHAQHRALAALCSRDDMEEIIAEVEAEES